MTEPDRPRRDVSIEEAERMPMTDEELAGVPESVRRWVPEANDDREENLWAEKYLAAVPLFIAKHDALVAEVRRLRARMSDAEVRRLRARMSDPEDWPVGYCATCGTAMRQSPNGQWWHEDTTHDHPGVKGW